MVIVPVAILLLAAPPRVDVSVGAGADSNPFELTSKLAQNPNANPADGPQLGLVVPISATVALRTPPHRTLRVELDSWLDAQVFPTVHQATGADPIRASDANQGSAYLGVPVIWDPFPDREVKADLAIEPFVGSHRETFTSRETGQPYLFTPTTGVSTGLGRRYDNDKLGVRVDSNVVVSKDVGFLVGGAISRVNYLQDYAASRVDPTTPDAWQDDWDYGELKTDVAAYVTPGYWTLVAGYAFKQRRYDARFPFDSTGARITSLDPAYVAQRFDYHDLSLHATWLGTATRWSVRYELERRIDDYSGYLDSLDHFGEVKLDYFVGRGATLSIDPSVELRTYDRARINFDPTQAENAVSRGELAMSYEWPASRALGLDGASFFVKGSGVRQVAGNSDYTFDAVRFVTGVHVLWR